MIHTININLNGLNFNANKSLTSSQNNIDFENFLNELFKLFFENKTSTDMENILFIPFFPAQVLTPQNIDDLGKIFETLKLQSEGLNTLHELIKSGQFELNTILEKFKINGNNKICLINELSEAFSVNLEKNSVKDLLKDLTSKKDIADLESLPNNLNKESHKLEDSTDSILNLINTESLKNEKTKINEINLNKEQKINNECLSSQINLNSGESIQNNNIQQKIELPLTKLNEIPDIIFKALFTSQKTLIVQLEPPELGKILIKLSMDSSGIKADMKVDYPYVKEMLTNLIPEIKSNLQSSGVKISDFLLDLTRDHKGYSDSYYGQGQKKYKENQKFYEYFA